MGLFSAIYDRVNEDLDDVVQVEINYVGDVIHRFVACLKPYLFSVEVRACVLGLVVQLEINCVRDIVNKFVASVT